MRTSHAQDVTVTLVGFRKDYVTIQATRWQTTVPEALLRIVDAAARDKSVHRVDVTRIKVEAVLDLFPDVSNAEIARRLNILPHTVGRIRNQRASKP